MRAGADYVVALTVLGCRLYWSRVVGDESLAVGRWGVASVGLPGLGSLGPRADWPTGVTYQGHRLTVNVRLA
jgi:hypothetical protein